MVLFSHVTCCAGTPLDAAQQQLLGLQAAEREVEASISQLSQMINHLQAENHAKVKNAISLFLVLLALCCLTSLPGFLRLHR